MKNDLIIAVYQFPHHHHHGARQRSVCIVRLRIDLFVITWAEDANPQYAILSIRGCYDEIQLCRSFISRAITVSSGKSASHAINKPLVNAS
jgi:hypothetical protein